MVSFYSDPEKYVKGMGINEENKKALIDDAERMNAEMMEDAEKNRKKKD